MCVIEDRIIPVDEGLKHRWLHVARENEHLLLPEGPFNMSIVNTMHDELLRIMELERYYDYFINHHQQYYAMMLDTFEHESEYFVHLYHQKKKKKCLQKKKNVYAPVVLNNKQHPQQRRQQYWKAKYNFR
jgi:hypothetical protein